MIKCKYKVASSSSGLGRLVLIQKIVGSTPAGATIFVPVAQKWRGKLASYLARELIIFYCLQFIINILEALDRNFGTENI